MPSSLLPLGDCRYCSLDDPLIGTIASLAAANCWSSSELSSTGLSSSDLASSGLSSSGLSSSEGTGSDSSLRAYEEVNRLVVWFEQSHHIFWIVLL